MSLFDQILQQYSPATSEALAAWVQAIGAILGMIVAFIVGYITALPAKKQLGVMSIQAAIDARDALSARYDKIFDIRRTLGGNAEITHMPVRVTPAILKSEIAKALRDYSPETVNPWLYGEAAEKINKICGELYEFHQMVSDKNNFTDDEKRALRKHQLAISGSEQELTCHLDGLLSKLRARVGQLDQFILDGSF